MTRTYEDRAGWLLRALAGRIGDASLADLRAILAARETTMLESTLLIRLRSAGVPLNPAEETVLRGMLTDSDDPRLAWLPRWDPDAPEPRYEFSPHHPGADEPDTERLLLEWASGAEQARRVLKAWRSPATSAAALPEAWVYVVELAPGTDDVPGFQSSVDGRLSGMGRVEVVAAGAELPAYQTAALAAGHQLYLRKLRR